MNAHVPLRAAIAQEIRNPDAADIVVSIPGNPRFNPTQVVWNGDTNVSPAIPSPGASGAAKSITITNTSNAPIYPFLRTANNGSDPHSTGPDPNGYYDPKDPHNQEYRLYVGYSLPNGGPKGGQYLGLPGGATITFQVPLVFWDGDNLFFGTEGGPLTSDSTVYNYQVGAQIAIGTTSPSPDDGTTWVDASQSNGYPPGITPIVMFYHDAQPLSISTEALAQLGELTFRDPYLLHFINDPAQTFPLSNYDVSFVNNLVAPAAMQASNVPIYYVDTNQKPVFYGYQNFGWTGSFRSAASFGGLTQQFVQNRGKARVGKYFDGKGWPEYYNPDKTPAFFNIPSGFNIFSDSPLNSSSHVRIHRSGYDQNRWNLTSAGDAPIQAGGSGVGFQGFVNPPNHPNTPDRIYLNIPKGSSFARDIVSMIQAGAVNIALTDAPQTVIGQVGQFVNAPGGAYVTYKGTNGVPITTPGSGSVFQFTRTASDYAITTITNLWYSWANYHVQQHQNFAGLTLPGTTTTSGVPGQTFVTNKIHFDQPLGSTIFAGMTVAADDLPDGTTVVKVNDSPDGRTSDVYLSRIPTDSATPPQSHSFTFGKPLPLPYDPAYTQPYALSFKPSIDGKPTNAQLFAASVYGAMAAMSRVPNPTTSPYLPASMNLVSQVIGFNQKFNDQSKPGYDLLVASIRDDVKSILRGVYDFYKVPNQAEWYPDPAVPTSDLTSGQPFNVYNLDPYVWFVHDIQKLNAYGFSLDDDVSNPGAGGPPTDAQGKPYHAPNALQMQFNGTNRLGNTSEWFPTIPWGMFSTLATIDIYKGGEPTYQNQPAITILNAPNENNPNLRYQLYQKINNPGEGQLGAYVYAPNNPGLIPIGTTLVWKAGLFPGQNPQIVMQAPPGTTITTTSTPITLIITANLPTTPPLFPLTRAGRG